MKLKNLCDWCFAMYFAIVTVEYLFFDLKPDYMAIVMVLSYSVSRTLLVEQEDRKKKSRYDNE